MPKITTFLTYDHQAEQAAQLYVSIFPNSKILRTFRYGEGAPMPAGSVMTVQFELDGQRFVALNGGPNFKFSQAISLVIDCKTQREVDEYSEKLTANGGELGPCGWVTDRFGVSWQIVPSELPEVLGDPDPLRAKRAMQAMMKMQKLDIEALKRAARGEG